MMLGAGGNGHDGVLDRGSARTPIVLEMTEELCTGNAVASTRQPHRSQQQQHQQQAVQRRTQERRGERGREENGGRRKEQGVRKEVEEGGSKVVEVETDWVTVKRKQGRGVNGNGTRGAWSQARESWDSDRRCIA